MKKKWMTVIYAILFIMLVMSAADTKAAAETIAWNQGETEVYTEGMFTYYIHPSQTGEEAWIYKIEIQEKKGQKLSIPEIILGKKVTRLGCPEFGSAEDDLDEAYATLFGTYTEPWHNWDGSGKNTAVSNLKSIQIPDTVEAIDQAAFSGLNSITTVKLPKNIKKIEKYTFYGCDKLKTITLPEQMESFQNSSLWGCPALERIKLSKKNNKFQVKGSCLIRKKNKALIFAVATGKKYTIPNGIKTIASYACGSVASPKIHIPASVSKIEKGAFNRNPWKENTKLKDITVSEKNSVYARDGQCIYKKSNKSLIVAIPDNKGKLRISERVKKLTPDMSVINCDTSEESLETVVYPSGLKHVTVPGFSILRARNVYFTGSVPPKVVDPDDDDSAAIPIFCHVYVPKANEKAYKKWYKNYGYYSSVDGWHTYNP